MIGRALLLAATALAMAGSALAQPQERMVEVTGVAPAGGDPAQARWRAIGDALRQAISAGGIDMQASTLIDRNVIRSDAVWATARGRVTGYRLGDEWRENGLLKVSITATIAPLDAPSCSADPLPSLHLGETRADIDPALDPGVVAPVMADFDHAMRRAFHSDSSDATGGLAAVPLAAAARTWDRYNVLAYGNAPGSGVYIRPYARLAARTVAGIGLVKGKRFEALMGLELIDAARGTLLGRVEREGDWTLASRGWEYLPADYRPARRVASPDMRGMMERLIEDAQELIRCRPVAVAVAGRQGDELLLAGGGDAGLRVGDILRVGEPTVSASESPEWPLAQVTMVSGNGARARLFYPENGGNGGNGGNVAVRLR